MTRLAKTCALRLRCSSPRLSPVRPVRLAVLSLRSRWEMLPTRRCKSSRPLWRWSRTARPSGTGGS
nr:MAG TPA: hypothetical protein [Caudoviricetes sp.]